MNISDNDVRAALLERARAIQRNAPIKARVLREAATYFEETPTTESAAVMPPEAVAVRVSGDVLKGFIADIPLGDLGVSRIADIDDQGRALRDALRKSGVHITGDDGLEIEGFIPLDADGQEI